LNDYISPEEKLSIALEMAKSLAVLHGHPDGPIAHSDVQVGQFFRGTDGVLKIVDYNRAEFVLYNVAKEEYCRWGNGAPVDGSLRAPEENVDAPLDESMDVYSLGNNLYSVLTGKLAWAGLPLEDVTKKIVNGERLAVPEFYREVPATHSLVRVMEACWTYDPEERPSIFDVVEMLEEAVRDHPVVEKAWA